MEKYSQVLIKTFNSNKKKNVRKVLLLPINQTIAPTIQLAFNQSEIPKVANVRD